MLRGILARVSQTDYCFQGHSVENLRYPKRAIFKIVKDVMFKSAARRVQMIRKDETGRMLSRVSIMGILPTNRSPTRYPQSGTAHINEGANQDDQSYEAETPVQQNHNLIYNVL